MERLCFECGRPCHEDASPGVWLHSSDVEPLGIERAEDQVAIVAPAPSAVRPAAGWVDEAEYECTRG